MNKTATLLSIYKSDKIENTKKAIESLLTQTYTNLDIYIICDGILTQELNEYLDSLKVRKIVRRDENKGLAYSLNELIDVILRDSEVGYLARMDADDICASKRIEEQVAFLERNQLVDIVGTDVEEIDENDVVIDYKKMFSHDISIKKNIIKRCPFNHPTVMFRRKVFEDGNRYSSELKNTQDYFFWIELASKNYVFANINKPLLKFRIDNNFFKRRGLAKANNDFKAKLFAMKSLHAHSLNNYFYAFAIYFLRIMPSSFSKLAYKYLR
ncbi:glycosyltransferase [Endozoicomonas sp. Mp262]|uniref:glycosyltransferase n=1 Tax=Endozoicomonas sp. Mp262 TaxID=2919499 RepID=UPI0021D8D700